MPRFRNVDRRTPMLLPPNLQDWVRPESLVHFLIEVIEEMDLSTAHVNERGSGSEQYPPSTMLALLIFCYAHGIFSSRQIERATHDYVDVRFLTGNNHPDHDTIAKFRRENDALLRSAFVQVLRYGQQLKLLRFGTLAIDGTKIKAAAQKSRTLTLQQLDQELEQLELKVTNLLLQAAQADAAATEESAVLPELGDAQKRREALLAAKAELKRQTELRHKERTAERERLAKHVPPRGLPEPGCPEPRTTDTVNLTDPGSSLTPGKQDAGFIQGYNAQIAVSVPEARGGLSLIVAAEVVRDTSDQQQLEPMIRRSVENLQQTPALVLADRGYDNSAHIETVEQSYRARVVCPPVRNAQRKENPTSRYRWERQRRQKRDERQARFETAQEKALYQQRNTTVEPAFGIIKDALGFNRFHLRGLEKVRTEWVLVTLAFNCRRIAAAKHN
jgi:transposase